MFGSDLGQFARPKSSDSHRLRDTICVLEMISLVVACGRLMRACPFAGVSDDVEEDREIPTEMSRGMRAALGRRINRVANPDITILSSRNRRMYTPCGS